VFGVKGEGGDDKGEYYYVQRESIFLDYKLENSRLVE
jgi:hypothetical protein